MHDDPLAGWDRGAPHEHGPGGEERERERGRLLEGEVLRLRQHVFARHDDELSVRAVARFAEDAVAVLQGVAEARRQHDLRAGLDAVRGLPYHVDDACTVTAGNDRQREGHAFDAAPHPQVEVVEARGLETHAHLVRFGLGNRDLLEQQLVGVAVLADDDRLHRGHGARQSTAARQEELRPCHAVRKRGVGPPECGSAAAPTHPQPPPHPRLARAG